MKKMMFSAMVLFCSVFGFALTPQGSFTCNIKDAKGMNEATISQYISRINFENYRLRDRATTLKFDNGFEIVLAPASQMHGKGILEHADSYQTEFSPDFKLPKFHMTPDGKVSAEYPVINSKYSSENR